MIIVTTNDYQSRICGNHHDHHMTVMLSLQRDGLCSRLLTTNVFVKSLSAFWRASRARMPCRMALTVFMRLFSVCASGTASPDTDPTPQIASLLHCTAAPGHPCISFQALISHTRSSLTHSQDLLHALTVCMWLLSLCASSTASKNTGSIPQIALLLQRTAALDRPCRHKQAQSQCFTPPSATLKSAAARHLICICTTFCAVSQFVQSAPMQDYISVKDG